MSFNQKKRIQKSHFTSWKIKILKEPEFDGETFHFGVSLGLLLAGGGAQDGTGENLGVGRKAGDDSYDFFFIDRGGTEQSVSAFWFNQHHDLIRWHQHVSCRWKNNVVWLVLSRGVTWVCLGRACGLVRRLVWVTQAGMEVDSTSFQADMQKPSLPSLSTRLVCRNCWGWPG